MANLQFVIEALDSSEGDKRRALMKELDPGLRQQVLSHYAARCNTSTKPQANSFNYNKNPLSNDHSTPQLTMGTQIDLRNSFSPGLQLQTNQSTDPKSFTSMLYGPDTTDITHFYGNYAESQQGKFRRFQERWG